MTIRREDLEAGRIDLSADIPHMNPCDGVKTIILPGSGEAMSGLCGFPGAPGRVHRSKRALIHRFGPFPRHSDALLPW